MRLPAAILLVVLAACGGSSSSNDGRVPAPAVQRRQLDVGGLSRSYRLYVPLSLDRARPAPLLLMLAGVGNSADSMVETTQFDRLADSAGFLVAYPEGVNRTWNAGYCCLLGAPTGPDDVGFLSRVIDDVKTLNKVDAGRVFAVGVSAGGMMAHRLGCERPDKIAGVGSVAGAMVPDACRPARPVSVIELHGTVDRVVPYEGGATAGGATEPSPPTVAVVERWAQLDRCPSPATTRTEGPVTTSTWTGCAEGTGVKLVAVEGGGHTWFAPGLGPANGAVDASREIWDFLSHLAPRR